jgi:hypothetical protein
MARSARQKLTMAVGAAGLMLLALAGLGFLRTLTNAERLDDRNLRELARLARGVEGRVNNLPTVMRNLSREPDRARRIRNAALIPHLELDTVGLACSPDADAARPAGATFAFDLALGVLRLCHRAPDTGTVQAAYGLSALGESLGSDYFEAIVLADATGQVFHWAPERPPVRVRDLAAFDTLQRARARGAVSTIDQVPIAGRNYRFYQLPLRVHIASERDTATHGTWVLGALVRSSSFRQESISLGPAVALLLALLALTGFLAAPFVRVFTMGPRERLGAGNLLYLIVALILGSGLIGLALADYAHFRQLRDDVRARHDATADTVARNVERELAAVLEELDTLGAQLRRSVGPALPLPFPRTSAPLEAELMRTRVPAAVYPNLHMAFWADSTGWQVAKWTPRAENTTRVNVSARDYFSALHAGRGWPRLPDGAGAGLCARRDATVPGTLASAAGDGGARDSMYVESIRSVTTGEKLAAISSTFDWRAATAAAAEPVGAAAEPASPAADPASAAAERATHPGVGVIVTELASLRQPVLPPGFQVAVVDPAGQTLFHSRGERILEEDFAEETDQPDLVRSMLSARACRAFDVVYGARSTRVAVRPLAGKPLFVLVLMDRVEMDTIRFEAWFIGAALFGVLALVIVACFTVLESSAASRIRWAWPDRERPDRYLMLLALVGLFSFLLALHVLLPGAFATHVAAFIVPIQLLGLGLVVLSRRGLGGEPGRGRRAARRALEMAGPDRESLLAWLTFALASVALLASVWLWRGGTAASWPHVVVTAVAAALVIAWLRVPALGAALRRGAAPLPARFLYASAVAGVLVVVGVMPGFLAYQVAFHAHGEMLVKFHQVAIAESLRARSARLDSIMRTDGRDASYRDLLRNHNFDEAWAGLVFDTREPTAPAPADSLVPAGADPWHGVLHRVLADRIPFLTDAAVGMRQMGTPQTDRSWLRARDDARPLERIRLDADPPLDSSLPPATGRFDGAWLLALLAALATLAITVYWLSRRVFFIHVDHPEPLSLEDALPARGEAWTPLILVGTRSISRAPLRERAAEVRMFDVMELRAAARTPEDDPFAGVGRPTGDAPAAICLDNFDHCFTDADWNRALLDHVERLIYGGGGGAVVLLTSRDPESALLVPDSGLELSVTDRLRWARVFGRFTKVTLADLVPPESLGMAIGTRVAALLLDDVNARIDDVPAGTERRDTATRRIAERLDWLDEEIAGLAPWPAAAPSTSPAAKVVTAGASTHGDGARTDAVAALAAAAAQARARLHAVMTTAGKGPAARHPDTGGEVAKRVAGLHRTHIDRLRALILRECGRSDRLQQIARQILARPGWHQLTPGEMLDLIREGADSYYSALWSILSRDERLVAAQLAAGAVVNPRSSQAVTRLFARGLIERGPELRLKNESFTRFVRESVPGDVLTTWERGDSPSTWEIVRVPLLLGWIGVALFLFWAQRDMLGSAVAFLSTAGVGLAAILRVLTMFERPGAPPPQTPA